MPAEWDETKRHTNIARHGVDVRFGYGEVRLIAAGRIERVLHVLVFTVERRAVRVISLRRANRKEVRAYAGQQATEDSSEEPPLAD